MLGVHRFLSLQPGFLLLAKRSPSWLTSGVSPQPTPTLSSAGTESRFLRQRGTPLYSVAAHRARDLPSCFCIPRFVSKGLGGKGGHKLREVFVFGISPSRVRTVVKSLNVERWLSGRGAKQEVAWGRSDSVSSPRQARTIGPKPPGKVHRPPGGQVGDCTSHTVA